MKDITDKNFGVIIAFLIPGFMLLWGLSYSSSMVAAWLVKSSAADAPTVGGFLYATLASLALGLLISAIRWFFVDHFLYYFTCLKQTKVDFSKLKTKEAFAAFEGVVENHYRYYQYYSNTFVAVVISFAAYLWAGKDTSSKTVIFGVILLCVVLLLASRDCLKKYHERAAEIAS
jgi:hypothetical protein